MESSVLTGGEVFSLSAFTNRFNPNCITENLLLAKWFIFLSFQYSLVTAQKLYNLFVGVSSSVNPSFVMKVALILNCEQTRLTIRWSIETDPSQYSIVNRRWWTTNMHLNWQLVYI